jgi:hypothetical protein
MVLAPAFDRRVTAFLATALTAIGGVGVGFVERMAVGAFSLGASCHVCVMRNRLKMEGALTAAITAFVINIEAFGDVADEEMVCEAMRIMADRRLESPIATGVYRALPFPARRILEGSIWVEKDFVQESPND